MPMDVKTRNGRVLPASPQLAYAVLEAADMVGFWLTKRWAEYFTFISTGLFCFSRSMNSPPRSVRSKLWSSLSTLQL
jgi:hypothetical protein